jgi:hypothetical protein
VVASGFELALLSPAGGPVGARPHTDFGVVMRKSQGRIAIFEQLIIESSRTVDAPAIWINTLIENDIYENFIPMAPWVSP